MKVLISGHVGFIGSHVYSHWKANHDVTGIDRPDDIEDFEDFGRRLRSCDSSCCTCRH